VKVDRVKVDRVTVATVELDAPPKESAE